MGMGDIMQMISGGFLLLVGIGCVAILFAYLIDIACHIKQRLKCRELILEQPPSGEYIIKAARNCMFRIGDTLSSSVVSDLIDRGIDVRIMKAN